MQKTSLNILIEAFGEIARGCKKIKSVLTTIRDTPQCGPGTKIPDLSQCLSLIENTQNESTPPQCGPGTTIPEKSQRKELPWVNFEAEKYLLSKSCIWGEWFTKKLLEHCIGESLRADRHDNQWVLDETLVRGWRSINQETYDTIFRRVQSYMGACKDILRQYERYDHFVCSVGPVRMVKFKRKTDIEESSLTRSAFAKYCRNVHKGLPSLRGHRKVV
jgi:hypothetical protein